MSLRQMTIKTDEMPRLRIGLKWDPLERDVLAVEHKLDSPGHALFKYIVYASASITLRVLMILLRLLLVFSGVVHALGKHKQRIDRALRAKRHYLAQRKMPSHDLDLLCFCYDEAGQLAQLISPLSPPPPLTSKARTAIIHSGEDDIGIGDGFDEELAVNLKDVAEDIVQIFFVVASAHHALDKIKGGSCAIISTRNEQVLIDNPLQPTTSHQNYLFAKLRRDGADWSLQEIAHYFHIDEDPHCPLDDTIDAILRNQHLG